MSTRKRGHGINGREGTFFNYDSGLQTGFSSSKTDHCLIASMMVMEARDPRGASFRLTRETPVVAVCRARQHGPAEARYNHGRYQAPPIDCGHHGTTYSNDHVSVLQGYVLITS
ncbi:uncharacterized protein LOC112127273 [Cimex lectularius]|uniref:Uncharacterized protein n=1 Tax=Cimex lectularius TaxID=79782 RepID=A0A8I6TMF9_CIMLE|nr:uncharacterized protein LOC112127273 [Cimex lectularius]